MRTKTLISLTLLILVCGFVLIENRVSLPPPPSEVFADKYYIGAMDIGNVTSQYSGQYDNMGFNLWHNYSKWGSGTDNGWTNWVAGDVLTAPYENYGEAIKSQVLSFAHDKDMRVLMDRVKIIYLCYGQRSDYQCESEDYYREGNAYPDRWFYTYSNHPLNVSTDFTDDDPNYGNGEKVRYSRTENSTNQGSWVHTAGYVVTGLKSNNEQINCMGFSHPYMKDYLHGWIVKPRIRAEKNYINNLANLEVPVCKIEVYKFNGDLIKSAVLKCRNFKPDIQTDYDGYYKEEFNLNPSLGDSTLTFPVTQTSIFNPDCKDMLAPGCQVDYKVYWYGNCDMWIDYVRVDNDVADQLFKGEREDWLQWEVQDIACGDPYSTTLKFYMEEFEFNNLPCMAYVARKIRALSQAMGKNYNLMCDLSYGEGFLLHVPQFWEHINDFDINYIKRNLVDSIGIDEIFTFAYPFNGYTSVP